jgi:acetoin utilization protein AcuB
MKRITVRDYMSATVHSVGCEQTLTAAHEVMREHAIRHLPVLEGGKLAGVLSLRDLHLIQTLPGTDPRTITVDEAMTDDIYTVDPADELQQVAREMAIRKIGSAVVVNHRHQVVGIFTTTDALRALADALENAASQQRPATGA